MHGAIFLLLYRRGGTLITSSEQSEAARTWCTKAVQAYAPRAAATIGFSAGPKRATVFVAGARVVGDC